ncbi:hypothetical protein EVAR_37073_1 [Eumeta japonica]|uniref:Uncharacterized protein n=1 Tax=Eumeta variegata TaxID=151549 RepID=A0A4C1WF54_EUMVA|nr:hypothetical protein EVAR_37073_1 [Eumeta japonica]
MTGGPWDGARAACAHRDPLCAAFAFVFVTCRSDGEACRGSSHAFLDYTCAAPARGVRPAFHNSPDADELD